MSVADGTRSKMEFKNWPLIGFIIGITIGIGAGVIVYYKSNTDLIDRLAFTETVAVELYNKNEELKTDNFKLRSEILDIGHDEMLLDSLKVENIKFQNEIIDISNHLRILNQELAKANNDKQELEKKLDKCISDRDNAQGKLIIIKEVFGGIARH